MCESVDDMQLFYIVAVALQFFLDIRHQVLGFNLVTLNGKAEEQLTGNKNSKVRKYKDEAELEP